MGKIKKIIIIPEKQLETERKIRKGAIKKPQTFKDKSKYSRKDKGE